MTTTKPKRPIVAERIALQAIIDDEQEVPHDHEDEEAFKYGFDDGASSGNRKAKLEIAEEIENHSYLAGTHEMCVWIDGLTKRLREEGK